MWWRWRWWRWPSKRAALSTSGYIGCFVYKALHVLKMYMVNMVNLSIHAAWYTRITSTLYFIIFAFIFIASQRGKKIKTPTRLPSTRPRKVTSFVKVCMYIYFCWQREQQQNNHICEVNYQPRTTIFKQKMIISAPKMGIISLYFNNITLIEFVCIFISTLCIWRYIICEHDSECIYTFMFITWSYLHTSRAISYYRS